MSAPALRVVPETGEIFDHAALQRQIVKLTGELALAEQDLRRLRRLNEMALLDKELQRQREPKRPTILDIFAEWQEVCRHPKAICDPDRFDVIRSAVYLSRDRPAEPFPERRYPRVAFSMAIAGAAFDPHRGDVGRNGRRLVYDDIPNILGSAAKIDRHIRKAPAGWLARHTPRPATPDQVPDKAERIPAENVLFARALVVVGERIAPADFAGLFDDLRGREPERARALLARLAARCER